MKGRGILIAFIFLLLSSPFVVAQSQISELTFVVYRDGYVGVSLSVSTNDTYVFIPLFGEHWENLAVIGDNDVLTYETMDGGILVSTFNSSLVYISYYTSDLTYKSGPVWTFNVSTNVPFKVVLPEDAVIVELSEIPLNIEENTLLMSEGNQTISYILTNVYKNSNSQESSSYILYIVLLAALAASVVLVLMFRERRRKRGSYMEVIDISQYVEKYDLKREEEEVIRYLIENGGVAKQSEIRKALKLPKTTMWRLSNRLERQGLVKIFKNERGENVLQLLLMENTK
ncbi:helix-turn-helix transcriptional regulator [Thermococcus litoralis]|uniref:helix-turn-helix transcriptional regulator n=1 Tax=Thermococcus litoralis TaxID=2265 RepID=UPI000B35297A|nr:winged helix-turn-helix transcriptional regulator [Thermococcus litoralis]